MDAGLPALRPRATRAAHAIRAGRASRCTSRVCRATVMFRARATTCESPGRSSPRSRRLKRDAGRAGPSMGLVAEFVAETGLGSGTIEIAPATSAMPGERCTFPTDTLASQLYLVRSGEPVEPSGDAVRGNRARGALPARRVGLRSPGVAPPLDRARQLAARDLVRDRFRRDRDELRFARGGCGHGARLCVAPCRVGERALREPVARRLQRERTQFATATWPAAWALACMAALVLRARSWRGQERG